MFEMAYVGLLQKYWRLKRDLSDVTVAETNIVLLDNLLPCFCVNGQYVGKNVLLFKQYLT